MPLPNNDDDKYGLEPAKDYGLQTATAEQPNQNPDLPGATPKLIAAVKSGAAPSTFSKPTQHELDQRPQDSSFWSGAKAIGNDVLGAIGGIADTVTGGPTGIISRIPSQAASLALSDQERKAEGRSLPYRLVAGGAQATGIVDPTGMEEAARHGDTAGVIGHTVLPLAGAALGADKALTGGRGIGAIGDAGQGTMQAGKNVIGRILRNPEGEVRGAGVMDAIKHPLEIPTRIAEAVVPPREGVLTPTQRAEMEQRAQDLVRRGREQAILDRQAARAATPTTAQPFAGAPPTAPQAGIGSIQSVPMNPSDATQVLTAPTKISIPGITEPVQSAPTVKPMQKGQVLQVPVPREPLPGENPNYMASIPRSRLSALAEQGRPGAADQLRNIGKNVLFVPEEYPSPRQRSIIGNIGETAPTESTPVERRKIPGTSPTGQERRTLPIGKIEGPPPMRVAQVKVLQDVIDDPRSTPQDRAIATAQLADLQQNPFERHEGGDINQMKAAGKKTLSREEAEENVEKRKSGRNQRFAPAEKP